MQLLARTIERSIGSLMLCLAVACAAAQASSRTQTLVVRQRVAEAVTAAGVPISAEQVELLSEIRTLPGTSFAVAGVKGENRNGTVVKLRCQSSRECLPFYVVLHGENVARDLGNLVFSGEGRPNRVAKIQGVKGGDRVTLILENRDMRIVMPVICLQNGALGQTIRVSSRDHKKTYEGEVVESGLVKGTL